MRICIVGVGNIGMRYVQGITKAIPGVELYLVDCDARLKELAKLKLQNVRFFTSLDEVDEPVDLFVVATSCDPRLSIYRKCLGLNPQYVILEKYLFKSREEFEECLSLARVPTFVNQWIYGSQTFDGLFEQETTSVDLIGSGWGLACNAVHWIDVFKRHMNITRLQVGDDTSIADVFPSKREGYEELRGEWIFEDRDSDKRFRLIDRHDDAPENALRIVVDGKTYFFDYTAVRKDEEILSKFPYFSDLAGDIVSEIFEKGSCSLPHLEESISQHVLIEDILDKLDRRPRIT